MIFFFNSIDPFLPFALFSRPEAYDSVSSEDSLAKSIPLARPEELPPEDASARTSANS